MPPTFVNANQLNQLGQLAAAAGPYSFPPGLATLAGFNPAAFFPPSEYSEFLLPLKTVTSFFHLHVHCVYT